MHFLKTAAFGAFALASLVVAQAPRLSFTSVPTEVTAGQPVTIQYTSQILTAPATIVLRKGDPSDLQDVTTLTNNAINGSYTWIPSKSLANASDYALQIAQGYQVNYSGQITLTGGNAGAVSSAKSASSSAKAAASSLTASAISSIESVIASYNSSLTNLTAIVSIQTSPPTPPANTTVVVVAPSVGTGSPIHRNTTIVSPTLTSSSSSGISSSSSSSRTTSSSGTSTRGSSTSAAASASSTGAAATLVQASTPVLALFAVAAVFFFQ
ncbi:hypothetical protein D6D01_01949 [Aureobasidium pullulans]|uniref:Yeast cell wall synthesis Kre9/Knh1-like N-terminal domain-containing protein n=1 Tax=Aureobasidium pullulans TaxID=5580 RepID=A0A4V6TF35_AURPU|nr:hypothetical protein D6D01_01949 [Aureobasidium pullulans]